jgi:hypothetical protein
MKITEVSFDLGTGTTTERVLSGDDGLRVIGAHVVTGLASVGQRWIDAPDGMGFSIVTLTTSFRRVMAFYLIEQPISPYALRDRG